MIYQEVLFTEDECTKILNYRFEYPNHIKTPQYTLLDGTRTVFQKIKKSDSTWIKKYNVWDIPINDDTFWFYDRIYSWFENESGIIINRDAYFNKPNSAQKIHEYNIGDKFDIHIDLNDEYPDRVWNLGIVLNSNFEGGEYICYDENTKQPNIIKKITGNVIAYSSNVPHEITEITKGNRYSMVIKIREKEIIKKTQKSLL